MRAGSLRHRVTFQTRDIAQDSSGQQVTTWSDYLVGVRADVQPLSGREILAAQAINAEMSHMVTLRYTPLLSDPVKVAAMRLTYTDGTTSHTLNLSSIVNVDSRNKQIDITGMEGPNVG